MGYTTEFEGEIKLNKAMDVDTINLIEGLAATRRMKRDPKKLAEMVGMQLADCIKAYGEEGELYFKQDGQMGQSDDNSIVDYNCPPYSQPSLWCDWVPSDDRMGIEWNGSEKFYNSELWMKYICSQILEPRGYIANGTIDCYGEDSEDVWRLVVQNNKVYVSTAEIKKVYSELKEIL